MAYGRKFDNVKNGAQYFASLTTKMRLTSIYSNVSRNLGGVHESVSLGDDLSSVFTIPASKTLHMVFAPAIACKIDAQTLEIKPSRGEKPAYQQR